MAADELAGAVRRLCRQFPGVPHDAVTSILGDSYRVVVEASGRPQILAAERLARLRLEVRTRHPAALTR
jgi:hypothetical protein